jgi:hypothetical protein
VQLLRSVIAKHIKNVFKEGESEHTIFALRQKFDHLTALFQASILKRNEFKEYLMMKNARWDNEVVLDYIEQHDSDAFKKHDEKVLKKDRKTIAKQLRDDGVAIEILKKRFNLTKEEIESL